MKRIPSYHLQNIRFEKTKYIVFSIAFIFGLLFLSFTGRKDTGQHQQVTYFIDSKKGSDQNSGKNKKSPWKTLSKLSRTQLRPGDSVCFKRGSSFTGPLMIGDSGAPGNYIVITDYGSKKDPAPAFSNSSFSEDNFGNCIRVQGSYVIVEHLYLTGTPVYHQVEFKGEGWVVWQMGAIHLERKAEHCIIRNNEIKDCVAGIRSNGAFAVIENNYIHDCNRVLKEWNWGPLGIWLGADHQEVRYNKIFNYSAVDPRIGWGPDSYGSGADGGAIEIDDARYDKSDISIHHNYSRDCQGFLEVTWTDVKQKPSYKNFQIHHNVSDDYQQFVALWWGRDCCIENNTIIRRKVNANEWGVFNITQPNAHNIIRNNIVVTENNIIVFNLGRKGDARPANIISNNLYFAAKGNLNIGKEGPGPSAIFSDPLFKNYEHAQTTGDFLVAKNSPAVEARLGFSYEKDFTGTKILQNPLTDLDALEDWSQNSSSAVKLAEKGKAFFYIQLPLNPTATEKFSAQELRSYLKKITGADFGLNVKTGHAINIKLNTRLKEEAYSISFRNKDLFLAGGSDRAILYAVYDFLSRLGCRFIAPQFHFYNGFAEYVPVNSDLSYDTAGVISNQPCFKYRKIDIEEGRSHNIENLRQIIDWMPKAGFNVLMVPLNYQGNGKVMWDNWREILTPEIRKRGLLIEVGGHGYQNFLNAKMQNGTLFTRHPEWFGKNKDCKPDTAQNLVFNTSNKEALDYFTQNILSYLNAHNEIDIFDFWPPDVAHWNDCPQFLNFGSAVDRQVVLVNQINASVKKLRRNLKLEIIAYGQVLLPPVESSLDPDVLVDICPINQGFAMQIFDSSVKTNQEYADATLSWRKYFGGDIGIYSYYRKYAWNSLPVILPHYIQDDLKWYAKLPLQGISTYAEPGDWFSYELNHYCLARLAWNPNLSVDSLINEYCVTRYGESAKIAKTAYTRLENVVRTCGSIPFTHRKKSDEIFEARNQLMQTDTELTNMLNVESSSNILLNLSRLHLMMNYAIEDLNILFLMDSGSDTSVESKVKQLVSFLRTNSSKGVFLILENDDYKKYLKHYTNRK